MIILCGNEVSKVKTWMFLTSPKGVLLSHPLLPPFLQNDHVFIKKCIFFGGGCGRKRLGLLETFTPWK